MFRTSTTINVSGLCLALAMAVPAGMTHAQEDPAVDCSQAMTQMEMNICADRDYQAADKELNLVYRQAMTQQRLVDKDAAAMGPDYVGAVDALKKAQRAWIDYRDGHCEGMGFTVLGGSMRPMVYSGCLETLTRNRTKELRELIQGMGGE